MLLLEILKSFSSIIVEKKQNRFIITSCFIEIIES